MAPKDFDDSKGDYPGERAEATTVAAGGAAGAAVAREPAHPFVGWVNKKLTEREVMLSFGDQEQRVLEIAGDKLRIKGLTGRDEYVPLTDARIEELMGQLV